MWYNEGFKGINYKDLHTMTCTDFHVVAIKALQEKYAQIKALEKESKVLHEKLLHLAESVFENNRNTLK